jgi:hypothetical protein
VPCSDGLPDAHEPRKDLGLYLRGAYCCTALSLKGLPDAPGLRKRPIQTPSSILRNTHRKDNDDHPFIDITPKSTPLPARLCCSTVARSRSLSLSEATVCVECLFLRTPIRAPYMTPSACAKRRPTRDPPPVVLHPESIRPSLPRRPIPRLYCPGRLPARIVSRHWGPPRACYRVPYCE